jgi:hypothetical protein
MSRFRRGFYAVMAALMPAPSGGGGTGTTWADATDTWADATYTWANA